MLVNLAKFVIIMYNQLIMSKSKSKYQKIGYRIRKAREAKGWTQSQLGEKLSKSLTATAISLYESGSREVGADVLVEIADLLDVRLNYLIKGYMEDEETPSVKVAPRSDKDLWNNQKSREQILDFIEFVKKKAESKAK